MKRDKGLKNAPRPKGKMWVCRFCDKVGIPTRKWKWVTERSKAYFLCPDCKTKKKRKGRKPSIKGKRYA